MNTRFKLILVIVAAFMVGALAAFALLPSLRDVPGGLPSSSTSGKALIGGPFELVDHNGRAVSDKDYRGRYMLVYFGFTHCPDICPAGLQLISAALDKIGDKAERLQPLFISLDPERDTPQKMATYLSSFHPGFIGLTGSSAQIAKVARTYRVYYSRVKNADLPGGYTVDHSTFFYLMSPTGEFVRHFSHSTSVDELARALAALPRP